MKQHIEALLGEVQRRLDELLDLRTRLRRFAGIELPPPPAVAEVRPVGPVGPVGQVRRRQVQTRGLKLGAQFGVREVSQVCGINLKQAHNTLARWKQRGWVERVGDGKEWQRSKGWPRIGEAAAPEAAKAVAPVVTTTGAPSNRERVEARDARATLLARLAEALKERDQAQARGNGTLLQILQDKVDDLQRRLDELG